MRAEYEAQTPRGSQTFDNIDDARQYVEDRYEGTITHWYVVPNQPGRLPSTVHQSAALWALNTQGWWGVSIHGPGGNWQEVPR